MAITPIDEETEIHDFRPLFDDQKSEIEHLIPNNNHPTLIQRAQSLQIVSSNINKNNQNNNKKPHRLRRIKSTNNITDNDNNNNEQTVPPAFIRRPTIQRKITMRNIFADNFIIEPSPIPHDEYDVDDAISYLGMGRFQWMLFWITGIIWSADVMEIMQMIFLLPIFKEEFQLTTLQASCIGITKIAGMFIGAGFWSKMADKFGRRLVIVIGVIGTAIFALLSAFAWDLYSKIIVKFLIGFFMSIVGVTYTLFSEFLPTHKRGQILILQGVFWSGGALVSVMLAWICLCYMDSWRWYIRLSTIPLWIAIAGMWFVPESIHFLVIDGQYSEAMRLLYKISEMNGKELPVNFTLHHNISHYYDKSQRGNIIDMFNGDMRIPSVLLVIVYAMRVFGYWGIVFLSVRYFSELESVYHDNKDSEDIYWEMMVTTVSEMPAIAIGYFMIKKGRKYAMNIAFAGFGICNFILVFGAAEHSRIAGVTLMFVSRMWIFLVYNVADIYFMEYYPTYVRATAHGFAKSVGKCAMVFTIICAEKLDIQYAMYVYGVCGCIGFVASLLLPVDTEKSQHMRDE